MKKNIGIVIQGSYKNSYTLENILFYKKSLKDIIICLSVWEDDIIDNDELKDLKKMDNVYIIFNKKPLVRGVQNVNYQIYSTFEGVKKLQDLNCSIVIKTRTDHRFDLIKLLSLNIDNKIIALETDDLLNSPFLVCDFLFYGKSKLIYKLFNIPLSKYGDNREVFDDRHKNIHWYLFYYKIAIENKFKLYAERHIIVNFFQKIGYTIPKNSFLARFYSIILITKHFTLINAKSLDYESVKRYKALEYQNNSYQYYKNLIKNNQLFVVLYKVVKYEMVEILRKILFYPKFLFQIWRIK